MRETFHWGIARCVYGFFFGTLTYEAWQTAAPAKSTGGTFAEVAALAAVVAFLTFVPGEAALEYLATPLFCTRGAGVRGRGRTRLARADDSPRRGARPLVLFHLHGPHVRGGRAVFERPFAGKILFTGDWLIHLPNGQAILDLGFSAAATVNDLVFVVYLAATIGLAALTWRIIERPGQRLFAAFVRPG